MLAVLLGAVYLTARALVPPESVALRWALAAALAAAGVAVVAAVRLLVLDVVFYRRQGHRAPALVHGVVALAMYVALGLVIAGAVFDQSLTGAIATSAIASVVLGLALQETLGNFFAGIALQVEQPFRLGDVVRADGHEGRVESINWRSATVRTVDDSRVVIPNALLARDAVEVFPRDQPNRQCLRVPVPYDAPPQQVEAVLQAVVRGLPGVEERPPPRVRLVAFDDSSVAYAVVYWTTDYLRVAALDAALRERVWYAFARNGISIPFPHEVQMPYRPAPVPADDDPVAERARWLGEVPLLAPLTPDERQWLAGRTRTLLYGPGETVLRAGDPGGSMFLVLRGRVEVRVPNADGPRLAVAEILAGDVMGEMSLLTGEPRSADVRALGEVELIEVRKPEIKELLAANDALASALADEVGQRMAQRADALALASARGDAVGTPASLLYRIRAFFDLD